jgi:poly(hydroxyalkanoate) depolymerase family esterase
MRHLGDTVARLAARQMQRAAGPAPAPLQSGNDRALLAELTGFGSNPGALKAHCYLPPGLAPGAPLVVVLHGCTQNAAGYDAGSGWSGVAREAGFALLFPEQARENNPNLCFNWFVPGDVTHGSGEMLSIRQMIDAMVEQHGIDRQRIFITGLSAGGAMAMAMLATAPHVFAGGAIIAGLPFASAASMPEAFDRMRGVGVPDAATVAHKARAAAPDDGPWPKLSVWHGSADNIVDHANAGAMAQGWAQLHGLGAATTVETVNGHERHVWHNPAGAALIESWTISGMGHGTPVTAAGIEACGAPMPFMLEAGVSSTRRIAAFWGLAATPATSAGSAIESVQPGSGGIEAIISAALRQAGLLR